MIEPQDAASIRKAVDGKIILIVEDDPDTAFMLFSAIEQFTPHQPLFVEDAAEVLCMGQQTTPALFLLDYHLGGMNGLDLYDRLHAMNGLEAVPAILISAATLPLEREQEIIARQVVLLRKPFDLDELFDTIDALLT